MGEGWRGRRKPVADFRARLECGDAIRLRMWPMEHVRFGCTAGLSHGYSLRWIEAWQVSNPEDKRINKTYAREEEGREKQ